MGLSGEAISDGSPLRAVFDDTSHDGKQPALVAFIVGDAARTFSAEPAEMRRSAVLGGLARLFGERARAPVAYADKDWITDAWSGGCYAGLMPPGVMTSSGDALREPCGRVHFAGTEAARRWAGYLDGAIESGERADDEIAARLAAQTPPTRRP